MQRRQGRVLPRGGIKQPCPARQDPNTGFGLPAPAGPKTPASTGLLRQDPKHRLRPACSGRTTRTLKKHQTPPPGGFRCFLLFLSFSAVFFHSRFSCTFPGLIFRANGQDLFRPESLKNLRGRSGFPYPPVPRSGLRCERAGFPNFPVPGQVFSASSSP